MTRHTWGAAIAIAVALTGCSAAAPEPSPSASGGPTAQASPAPTLDARPVQEQLDEAVKSGSVELARLALDAGADPNLVDETDNNALTIAITRDDAPMVEALLDAGAKTEWPEEEFTMLVIAALNAGTEVSQLLLDAGAQPNGFGAASGGPLAAAAYENNTELLEALLLAGADPNLIFDGGQLSYPPLVSAAYGGSLEAAQMLILYGADPDIPASDGATAKEWAEARGTDDVAAFLETVGG